MEAIQQIQKDYIEAIVAETSMTKKKLKGLLERKVNVYLSAEEAVELGIADIII
jgi:ATP-dependent protease ClpP protease subunit